MGRQRTQVYQDEKIERLEGELDGLLKKVEQLTERLWIAEENLRLEMGRQQRAAAYGSHRNGAVR